MKRRDLLKGAALGALAIAGGREIVFAKEYFPAKVDASLFKGINKPEHPENKSQLAKLHVPIIKAPETVKTGQIFAVDVTIGEILHPMGPAHWIEHVQVNIGNEPAGSLMFQSQGYMKPEGRFNLILSDSLKGKEISLVVQNKCNRHGIWQSHFNVKVT
jgi:superoxide reductase